MPSVDVLIPTYNRKRWLPDCIRSLRGQTFKDFRVLIWDDGSTDGSTEALQDLEDDRFLVLNRGSTVNHGIPFARNALLRRVEAPLFCWQDSDDIAHPNRLETMVESLRQAPHSGGFSYLSFFTGSFKRKRYYPYHVDTGKWDASKKDFGLSNNLTFASGFFRRELAQTLFDLTKDIAEDYDWIQRLLSEGHRFLTVPEVLYYARRHPKRTTTLVKSNQPKAPAMNTYPLSNGDVQLGDFPARRDQSWTNVVWVITHECNLGCPYCIGFAAKGKARSLLDHHSQEDLVKAFEDLRGQRQLYLTLSGGEPTLIEGFAAFCALLAARGFRLELQTNLVSSTVRDFLEQVPPKAVGQVMATYHGWKLDHDPALQKRYFEHFKLGVAKGFTMVLKTIVRPEEVETFPDKVEWFKTKLPSQSPVLTWPFIKGDPTKSKSAYPYAYTEEQGLVLDSLSPFRRTEQRAYRQGAGWFKGMRCDAGRGFFYLDVNGVAAPCWRGMRSNCRLGSLTKSITLYPNPQPCPYTLCSTPFWPLWYGQNPWDYCPKATREEAHYCRYGP